MVGFVMVMPPGPIAMACMRQPLRGQTKEAGPGARGGGDGWLCAAGRVCGPSALVEGLGRDDAPRLGLCWPFRGCIVVLVVVGLHHCRSSRHRGAARPAEARAACARMCPPR